MEIANELWVMVSTDLMFVYTETTPVVYRYRYGYVYILLFACAWLSNFTYFVRKQVIDFCRKKAMKKAWRAK